MKIGKREAYRIAIKTAAAHFETMDLEQIFGEDVVGQIDGQPGLDQILDQAHKQAVARIRAIINE